jgi:hypothetical protein
VGKLIRLNPRRKEYILKMTLGNGSVIADIEGRMVELFISASGDPWAEVEEVIPAVQRYLSRIPLAPADDESPSSVEASADALVPKDYSRSLAHDASGNADSSASGDGEPQAESLDSAGDLSESIPDDQGEDESSNGISRDSETAEQHPGSASSSGDDGDEESVPDGQAREAASAAESPAAEEATSGALDSDAVQQRCGDAVLSAGDGGAPASENIRRTFISRAELSRLPKSEHGGVFAQFADVELDRAMIARARRAFRRMLLGGETKPGPRWNARAVATKTAGYLRSWTVSDRRRESGRPALLILPDVSGSMGRLSSNVVAFAVACYGTLSEGDIVCVTHSNGEPVEYMPDMLSDMDYEQIIRQRNVRAIVIAADHDGEDTFFQLAHLVPRVYWLSPFGCNQMERPRIRDTRKVLARWPDGIRQRVMYADGCGDPDSCLTALEMMV